MNMITTSARVRGMGAFSGTVELDSPGMFGRRARVVSRSAVTRIVENGRRGTMLRGFTRSFPRCYRLVI